ncbi:MAG: hypothetical protein Q4B70_11540, partial [Lachnospiraceae bacterium]|nr:hypothetical protein [Lachnospiraceae bacterium]
ISSAKTIKGSTVGATVYTIGIFDGANPNAGIGNGVSNENKFMQLVSSNYPNASSMTSAGTINTTVGYYKAASSSGELNSVFTEIEKTETSSSTSVTLDGNSVLRDVIETDNFQLADASAIKVYTADSDTVSSSGITWKEAKIYDDAVVSVSADKKTIDVKGFSYKDKYVTENHPGSKIIVQIPLNALHAGENLLSNKTTSGIYDKAGDTGILVKAFPTPTVDIAEKSYVLDFAKKAVTDSTDYGLTSVSKLNGALAAPTNLDQITKKYGIYAKENNTLSYTPKTLNWDGYDSGFVFGTKSESAYDWAKVNFIPATSVYYEDDFNKTETTETDSSVKIIYTGGKTTTVGTSQSENQSIANSDYGTDSSYDNDATYSNGSVTKMESIAESDAATAKFTFTGTGVDIYSTTDTKTAMVMAEVTNEKGDIVDLKVVDTVYENGDKTTTSGASGELYQIPTLSINLDKFGKQKYTVELTVAAPSEDNDSGRCTYYLDGIRIYNPLGSTPTDATVKAAYEEANEYASAVVRLRDILLGINETKDIATAGNASGTIGIAYIDNVEATSDKDGKLTLNTTNLQAYKEYGPKSEVYLAPGNTVSFKVNKNYGTDKTKYMLGIKSPTGNTTSVTYTNGDNSLITNKAITSATDMYYTITPTSNGYITVTNSGDYLLSLTKLKVTQVNTNNTSGLIQVSTDVLNYTAAVLGSTSTSTANVSNYNVENKITTQAGIPASQALKEETATNKTDDTETTQEAVEEKIDLNVDITNTASNSAKEENIKTVWSSLKDSVAEYLSSK